MPAPIITLAEAVKDSLNDATFSQSFEATRRYEPDVPLETMGTGMHVTVVASAEAIDNETRRSRRRTMDVDVLIQKRLTQDCDPAAEDANTELDALMAFVEEVVAHFAPATFADAGALLLRVANEPKYDRAQLTERRVFTSLLTVTFILIS